MDFISVLDAFVNPVLKVVPKLPEALLNLAIGYVLIKIIIWIFEHLLRISKMPKLKGILVSLAKMVLWLILIILITKNLGFSNLAVAISGSVLILAFILNNAIAPLVSDVLSGVFLCTDQDFKPGTLIKIGKGKDAIRVRVIEVDMRKVRLEDEKGQRHVFPNSVVDKNEWVVIERPGHESIVKTRAAIVKDAIKNKIKNNGKSK